MSLEIVKNLTKCLQLTGLLGSNKSNGEVDESEIGISSNIYNWEIIVIMVVLGIFTALIAKSFNGIRARFYQDKSNLDTDFDAGGQVSIWLTATTIVSQWTWSTTLLQSCTVASKYGISGPFWYAAGATIQILIFAMISIQLKIKAPGAKTFLQVVRARFGKKTHLVFCFFALMTNLIVTSSLMLGGTAVMTSLVQGMSLELCTAMVVAVMGTYTFIGCLGATFYVSYFNTAVIFAGLVAALIKVYHDNDEESTLGSIDKVYEYITCAEAPEGNVDNSFLTIKSSPGLMFGIINIIGNFGTVFADQAYWQSSVAAKPRQGIWGFFFGGLIWFAIPFTFATTMGLAYIAMSTSEGHHLLSQTNIDQGLVAPLVAQKLMGKTGELLIIMLMLMAIMSTGSAEIIAVVSILVYDVYQLYVKPYRRDSDHRNCILCGKRKLRFADPGGESCQCISMTNCKQCEYDDVMRRECKEAVKPAYTCTMHGSYRTYNDFLKEKKDWCVVWVSLFIIPLVLVLYALKVTLGWLYLITGVMIGAVVFPIALSIFWARLTGIGMVVGAVGGTLCGCIGWLVTASTYPGGLSNFENTGKELSMLMGNVSAIVCGAILSIVISFITNRNFTAEKAAAIWEDTRDIDNPLSPWTEKYASDMGITSADRLSNRPSFQEVDKTYVRSKRIAYIGATVLSIVLVIIWPSVTLSLGTFSLTAFSTWVNLCQAYGLIAAFFIVFLPLIYEVIEVKRAIKKREGESKERQKIENEESKASLVHDSNGIATELSDCNLSNGSNKTAGNHASNVC